MMLIIVSLWFAFDGNCQGYEPVENKTVLKEFGLISKKYQGNNFQLKYNKIIYRDSIDLEVIVDTKGSISKGTNLQYRMEEKGTVVIQNEQLKMTVDSASFLVMIGKPDTIFKTIDVAAFLDGNALNKYSFKRSENKGVIKYLIIPNNRLEGITELWVKAKDYTLEKLILSLPKANYFNESLEDETLESPQVVITYQPMILLDNNAIGRLFSQDEWLKKENNKYSLNTTQSLFRLHDLRYNP